jgi:Tol biopolymer transport system component
VRAFQSNFEGQLDIDVVPAAGGSPRSIAFHPAADNVPSFSRDGRWIYFASLRTGEYQVWKAPTAGGDPVQVTFEGGFLAIEGTNDDSLYYTNRPESPTDLWRLPIAGGPPVKVLEGVVLTAFDVLERGIYFIDRRSGQSQLRFFDFATKNLTTIAPDLGMTGPLLSASPDGTRVYFTRSARSSDLMLVENFR